MGDCSICDRRQEGSTYLELGPAYDDFKNDIIDLSKSYKRYDDILIYFGSSCCAKVKFEPFYFRPDLHAHFLWVFSLVYIVLVILIIKNKDKQPIRFRGADHMIFHLTLIFLHWIFVVVGSSAAYTAVCDFTDIASWVLIPIIYWYYVLQSLQLAFVYNWSFAKLKGDNTTSKWYFKYKNFLNPSLIYYWCLFITVLGFIGYGASRASIVFDGSNNFASVARCFWWDIPQEYTIAQNPGPACACYDAFVLSDTSQDAACQSILLSTCVNGTIAIPPLTLTETTEICSACVFSGPDGQSSRLCQDKFISWISTGACGWPASTPDFSHCFPCMYADPDVYAGWVTFKFLIIACIIYGTYLTARMDDKLLVRYEIMSLTFGALPLDIISIVMQQDADFAQHLRRLLPNFEMFFAIGLTETIILLIGSHIIPVIACYVWIYVDRKKRLNETPDTIKKHNSLTDKSVEMLLNRKSAADRNSQGMASNLSEVASASSSWLEIRESISGKILDLATMTQQEEMQLAFVMENEAAFKIYADFSCKEFTIENILFLRAIRSLHLSLLRDHSKTDHTLMVVLGDDVQPQLTDLSHPMDHVYYLLANFIKIDSPMQVNIPARMRLAVEQGISKVLGSNVVESKLTEYAPGNSLVSNQNDVNMSQLHNITEILASVVQEVKRLIVRDSWTRFSRSAHYDSFLTLYQAEEKEDHILSANLEKIVN